MLDLVLTVVFCAMAYKVAAAIARESPVFREFGQSRSLGLAALLFPIGPIVLFSLAAKAPLLAPVACAACYVPALLLARLRAAAFEQAGTDRVKGAMAAVFQAYGTALVGLIYASIVFIYVLALGFLGSATDA